MRILTLTSSTTFSGGVRQAVYQTAGLRALGHDARLCLPADSALWGLPDPEVWWVRLPEKQAGWRDALDTLIGGGPAVVHAFHNRAVKLTALWGLAWRRRGVACAAHRGIITRPANPLPYWSPAMRRFVVNSRACARSLRWHCPSFKIRVLANGVPDERVTPRRDAAQVRSEWNLDGAGLVLGNIGNDNPVKGTEALIQAFAAARGAAREAVLLLIGVTPGRWLPLARQLHVEDRVRVAGHYDHVSDLLQVCDAFVFPSQGMDSAPNALLEAVRMGLPVVSTDVGGCPDIVDGNGLLVRAGREDELTRALEAVCADAGRRAAWSVRSRELSSRYTVEARCRALESLYEDMLREV